MPPATTLLATTTIIGVERRESSPIDRPRPLVELLDDGGIGRAVSVLFAGEGARRGGPYTPR